MTELPQLVERLADARRAAAQHRARIDTLRAEFDQQHAAELRAAQEAAALVAGLEGKVREAACAEYRSTGIKAPARGVTIAVAKKVRFDEQRVLGWALKRQACLQLDAKAFEALAKRNVPLDDQGQPLATVEDVPSARISTHLDQVLAGAPADPGVVRATATTSWQVPSSSTPGVTYIVTQVEDGSRTCTCPGFQGHGHCKHVGSVPA